MSSTERSEAIEKVRERLRDAYGILDLHAAEFQPRYRETHGDSMIVVSLDGSGMHSGRHNLEPIVVLDDSRAEPSQFSRECADAIAFVMPDERDVADLGRRRRERSNRG